MNIGIFGGTFNPVHTGHITASLKFYDKAQLSLMYVIPDKIPPHKGGEIAEEKHRLCMTKLVYEDKSIIGERNIVVSDIEIKREGKSYTILTVKELIKKHPGANIYLYTGSDMFYTLESWHMGDELLRICSIVTAAREENETEKLKSFAKYYFEKFGTNCIILDYAPIDVSSTEIRNEIKNGIKNIKDGVCSHFTKKYLTDSVIRYIMENNLYCEQC